MYYISIQSFRLREAIETIYEGFKLQESVCPKDTTPLPEQDRYLLTNRLNERKSHLLELLRNQPITLHLRSISVQQRQNEIEKILREIDCVLDKFTSNWHIYISL